MDEFLEMLKSLPLSILALTMEYRLLNRILVRKYSAFLTILVMLAVDLFAGWLNVYAHLADSIEENALYYGAIAFVLYIVLFKGNLIKKLFVDVLIVCGVPIIIYVFLPLIQYFFAKRSGQFILVLDILNYIYMLLCLLFMEFVGRKFQNLRRELPNNYTFYLSAVIVFVYIAIYAAYDRVLLINEFAVPFLPALTCSVFAVIGIVIVGIAIFAVDRQVSVSLKEQLQVLQVKELKSREAEWRRFSGFRHDINNHLICLEGLLKSAKIEQAVSYMQNLTDTVAQFESPVQTGNDYTDALLSFKYSQAVTAGIEITIEMVFPQGGFIEPVDLCCILSNAFDNAIAACNRLQGGQKWIQARSFISQEQLVIDIRNSKPSDVCIVHGEVLPKDISPDHGLGLDNVRAVVQKYGGILDLSAHEFFSFSVLLPLHHL